MAVLIETGGVAVDVAGRSFRTSSEVSEDTFKTNWLPEAASSSRKTKIELEWMLLDN